MSTHYTAGGMPLAFTQEDFLVWFMFNHMIFSVLPMSADFPTIFSKKEIPVPLRRGQDCRRLLSVTPFWENIVVSCGGSRISSGGVNPQGGDTNLLFDQYFPKTAWNQNPNPSPDRKHDPSPGEYVVGKSRNINAKSFLFYN